MFELLPLTVDECFASVRLRVLKSANLGRKVRHFCRLFPDATSTPSLACKQLTTLLLPISHTYLQRARSFQK